MSESLGPPVAWQIRDVPEKVRDMVVDQARQEGIKVGELITRIILAARDGAGASNQFANPLTSHDPGRAVAVLTAIAALAQAGVPVQRRLAAAANRAARLELEAIMPPTKALPAPKIAGPSNTFANPSDDADKGE